MEQQDQIQMKAIIKMEQEHHNLLAVLQVPSMQQAITMVALDQVVQDGIRTLTMVHKEAQVIMEVEAVPKWAPVEEVLAIQVE